VIPVVVFLVPWALGLLFGSGLCWLWMNRKLLALPVWARDAARAKRTHPDAAVYAPAVYVEAPIDAFLSDLHARAPEVIVFVRLQNGRRVSLRVTTASPSGLSVQ
jgi:hypothetical protein